MLPEMKIDVAIDLISVRNVKEKHIVSRMYNASQTQMKKKKTNIILCGYLMEN